MDSLVALFSQHSRRLATLASVAMIMLIMASVAQTVLFFLEHMNETQVAPVNVPAPSRSTSESTVDLAALSLFGRVRSDPVEAVVDAPETRLNLELKGIFTAEDPDNSTAIISERNKAGELYRVGDRLPGNAVLSAINDDHILLRRGGRTEKLMFPDAKLRFSADNSSAGGVTRTSTSASTSTADSARMAQIRERLAERRRNTRNRDQANGNTARPSARTIREYISQNRDQINSNPAELLSQAGLSPVQEGDAKGYRVSGAGAESPLLQAGLKPGDVVMSVNGQPVGNAMNDSGLVDQALAAGRVRVEVQRADRRFFLTVPIPD